MDNRTNVTRICVYNTTDLIGQMEKAFTLFYPLILTVCLISNTANLAIYQHKFLRSSPTIRMLAAKAIANMISTISVFPNFLKSVPQWSERKDINDIYWIALPYMMFITNIFATFAIWLTMAVSIERYVMVAFPVQAKYLCTMRNATLTIIGTFLAAVLLQAQSFVARKLFIVPCFDTNTSTNSYYYVFAVPRKYSKLQHSYYYSYSITTIVTPMAIMVLATLLINYHLFWASKRFANSAVEQKRCVTRLSLSTTICHLIFEMPHFAVFIVAAVTAENVEYWKKLEPLTATANFLSILNNSIPFFIYLLCSKRYRLIAKTVLCCAPSVESNDLHTDAAYQRAKLQDIRPNNQLNSSFPSHPNFLNSDTTTNKKSTIKKRSISCSECKLSNVDLCGLKHETSSLLE